MNFSYKTMGNVLKAFLVVEVVITGLLVITAFFYTYAYPIYENILIFDQALSSLNQIVWVLLIIFYLIWIFKVHVDLKRLNPYYRIKPGGALARIMIPLYNLYGMWNIYSTMGYYFKGYPALESLGRKLIKLLPIYYFLYIGTRFLERLIMEVVIINVNLILAYYVLDFISIISMLYVTKTIMQAFNIIEADYETYLKEEEELPKWAIE
ncbi:hypothetical protein [Ornithinibacillus sp. 179-J 7C1 HS]|uniref:hypothetical protein n=1 Tax=Ornithinibacillus sp. 179-J 7C1 HS TaxID=3142384 RepID=UPI0039A0D42B